MSSVTYRAAFACSAATSVNGQQPAGTCESHITLGFSRFHSKCTDRPFFWSVSNLRERRHGELSAALTVSVWNRHATQHYALSQTQTATLTCSQKLIVNLVIAAGSNLVTESLDFTVPCIGRYGLCNTDWHASFYFNALTLSLSDILCDAHNTLLHSDLFLRTWQDLACFELPVVAAHPCPLQYNNMFVHSKMQLCNFAKSCFWTCSRLACAFLSGA